MLEQTVAKNKRLSKSLLRFSIKRRNQTYIIPGNAVDAWRKTSLKKLKTNQNLKKTKKKLLTKSKKSKPNDCKINQIWF